VNTPVDDLRHRVGSTLRRLLVGDSERRGKPAEDGLFAPDSATWIVHADAAMLVGGIRALLLQTLHPPTMAGVADHSDYKSDPLGRLQRTSRFLGTTTFGSVEEAERAIQMVRSIHDGVQGVTPDGEPYRANDPHLLRWVHITEVDSFLVAKQRFGSTSVDASTADRYVSEMSIVARKLGATDLPESTAELTHSIELYLPELRSTQQSRQALRFIAFAPLPLHFRGPYAVLLAGAVSTLPRWARQKLRLPRLPMAEAVAVRPAAGTLTRMLEWSLRS
jgi:uncharacterized protein (DUF2236 family)